MTREARKKKKNSSTSQNTQKKKQMSIICMHILHSYLNRKSDYSFVSCHTIYEIYFIRGESKRQ